MRLDAAPIAAFRAPGAARARAVSAAGPTDPATASPEADTAAPVPPPSIDGKGTLINTYA